MTATAKRPSGPPPPPYELAHEPDGTSWTARENLADILRREMLGPRYGADEVIQEAPENFYLLGRVAPAKLRPLDADPTPAGGSDAQGEAPSVDVGDELDASLVDGVPLTSVDDDSASADEDTGGGQDEAQKRGLMIPASMGLRFQVPLDVPEFVVIASWGSYEPFNTGEVTASGRPIRHFRRTPVERPPTTIPLADLTMGATKDYPLLHGEVTLRVDRHDDAARGCAIIEIALCNDRHSPRSIPTPVWLFQTRLEVVAPDGAARRDIFLPINDVMDPAWDAPDDTTGEQQRLALQYRDRLEFAMGRTCSADWDVETGARRATAVRTTWLPVVETPQVAAIDVAALLDMRALDTEDVTQLKDGLSPLVTAYGAWLDDQDTKAAGLPTHLRPIAAEALHEARQVQAQLAEGLAYLLDPAHAEARRCFAFMNRVMAEQRIATQVADRRAKDPRLTIADAHDAVITLPPGGDPEAHKPHHWRAFQLAFVLMQLPSLCEPGHRRRSSDVAKVELLFFPTGGGKTEAYLGLAAFVFAIRRRDAARGLLQTPDGPLDSSDGVAVLMRYTLRLLTAQQFQRATALICAAELARRADPTTWGSTPFRIGLWVGSDVSPKKVKDAAAQLRDVSEGKGFRLTALQFKRCPWCGQAIGPANVRHVPETDRILVSCANALGSCPFAFGNGPEGCDEGLPVLTVDEEIYRLTPAFVIATVDKFARLAREGEAAALFGRVDRCCPRHGFAHPDGPCGKVSSHQATDTLPGVQLRPATRLRPPDLIIQDELHLITGALGTTVGLFEVAVDLLSQWTAPDGQPVKALVVASSATVRNAQEQVRNLYGRGLTIFPPQVLDASETFFSTEVAIDREHPGRRYLGLSTTGVKLTTGEIRLAEALMGGGQLLLDKEYAAAHPTYSPAPKGQPEKPSPVDPYLTLVGYFSSTRELAGMTRYLDDDVQELLRLGRRGVAIPRRYGTQFGLRTAELTSRVSNSDITATLDAMAVPFTAYDTTIADLWRRSEAKKGTKPDYRTNHPYDAVLATSMLQVGVDVSRLGLMMIVGQPKNTAEYIQASSRVGRSADRPGLVVTISNWARPRDLAHFEQFRHYHETFYANVEPLSVTPFSPTSLERGLDGVLVSLARVADAGRGTEGLSPEQNAWRVKEEEVFLASLVGRVTARILAASDEDARDFALARLTERVERWAQRRVEAAAESKTLVYERMGGKDKSALITSAENADDLTGAHEKAPFVVANSMREVQPEINLLVSPDPDKLLMKPVGARDWQLPPVAED